MTTAQLAAITTAAMQCMSKGDKAGAMRLISQIPTNQVASVMRALSGAISDKKVVVR